MIKLIIKNSAIYGILPQLPKIASFFVLPFITPFLTPVDYGVIGIIDVYIGLIGALHFLGLNVRITNIFFNHPHHYKIYWRQIYGFLMLWSIIYVALLSILIYIALPEEAIENRVKIILLKTIPELLFAPAVLFMTTYYRLKQHAWPIAGRSMLAGFIAVFLNYYTIAVLKLGYMGWIYSSFISACIGGIIFMIPMYSNLKLFPIFNFKRRLIKSALKVGLPVIPHNYSHYLINSSDRLVMERLNVPTFQIGLYNLAYTLGSYINIAANAVNQAIGPNLILFAKEGRWKEYQDMIFAFQSLVFLTCFILSVWVKTWMPLLIRNDELIQFPELFIIIAMSYTAWPMYVGCNQVLFYFEKTNVLWKITTVAGVINVIANIVLIPVFGFMAAAWTTFGALLFQGFTGYLYKHFKQHNQAKLYPFFWFILILISLPVILLTFKQMFLIKIIVSLLGACAVVFLYLLKRTTKLYL